MKVLSITSVKRAEDILNIASKTFDIPKEVLSSSTRKQKISLVRMAYANLCRDEGIHHNILADILNRDRCSIYHYQTKHVDNYNYWGKYRDIFNQLHSQIYDTPQLTLNKAGMQRLLHRNGIKIKKKGRVQVNLQSGTSKLSFYTGYSTFCKVAEQVQKVIEPYNIDMEIAL